MGVTRASAATAYSEFGRKPTPSSPSREKGSADCDSYPISGGKPAITFQPKPAPATTNHRPLTTYHLPSPPSHFALKHVVRVLFFVFGRAAAAGVAQKGVSEDGDA